MQDESWTPPRAPDAAFRDFLRQGEIRLQQCQACDAFFFYPRALCPHCGSNRHRWQRISGRGRIYSLTIERSAPERGGDRNLVLVDLDEGPRLLSRVLGVDAETLRIGQNVVAVIEEAEGELLIYFTPAK